MKTQWNQRTAFYHFLVILNKWNATFWLTQLYIDNQSAMKLAKHLMTKPASRHILLRYHWLREQVREKILKLSYVRTDDNLADPFTKVLPKFKFQKFVNTWLKAWRGVFDIGNIQALAVYNLVFTAPYLRALAGGARRSNYTKWQTKVAPKQFGAKQSKVAPEAPNKEKWRLWRLWRQIKERPFL